MRLSRSSMRLSRSSMRLSRSSMRSPRAPICDPNCSPRAVIASRMVARVISPSSWMASRIVARVISPSSWVASRRLLPMSTVVRDMTRPTQPTIIKAAPSPTRIGEPNALRTRYWMPMPTRDR